MGVLGAPPCGGSGGAALWGFLAQRLLGAAPHGVRGQRLMDVLGAAPHGGYWGSASWGFWRQRLMEV